MQIQPGQRLFRSWLLLFGVIPIDYDDICIAQIGPGYDMLIKVELEASDLRSDRLGPGPFPGAYNDPGTSP